MGNATEAFLGSPAMWRNARIELDDIDAQLGGKHIVINGDGAALVKIVDLTHSEELYELILEPEHVVWVVEACVQNDILSIAFPAHERTAADAHTTLSLTNAGSEVVSVSRWAVEPATDRALDQRFEDVCNALTALYESLRELGAVLVTATTSPADGGLVGAAPDDQAGRAAQRVLQEAIAFFQEDAWECEQLAGRPILRLPFQGKNGRWNCFAQVRTTAVLEQLLFYSVLPVTIPEEKRPAIAEFITRANYAMAIGNFEMDYSDGEVRFKTSLDVTDTPLTPALLKPLVYISCTMLDKYLPGIMSVIYAHVSPAEAVQQIEG